MERRTAPPVGGNPPLLRRLGDRRSVGSRVLFSMVLLALLTLLVAGSTSYAVQRGHIAERIDDSLTRSVREFRVLANGGVDIETGQPFTTAESLVYLAMQRTLPAPNEGMMALAGGRVHWQAPENVDLRLERDAELVRSLVDDGAPDRVTLRNVTTATTSYRLVSVPVQLAGDSEPMEFVLAYDADAELHDLSSTYLVFLGAGVGSLVLATLLGWMMVTRLLNPIRELRLTAEAITEHDLEQRLAVRGADDLAELSATFNNMLDRLQAALRSQRQLLDDVGHEMRTPITIIQGHLELQDNDDPQDVAQTRSIALDELDRMSLLVEDLVTLAKSDRNDFVKPSMVELDHLLDDVLDKASALGARRWIVEQRAHGSVELDAHRINQALLQLCQNAVKFSAPGSSIALGSAVLGDVVRLWVRDEGVGIRPEDREAIFERFARGSNGRRAEGSGLGLTIVRAIAAAHGGSVSLQSTPVVGSTFYLDLPLRGFTALPEDAEDKEAV
jgi:two-component system, OmpR family, sensor kinase